MSIRELISKAGDTLRDSSTPMLDAEILLSCALRRRKEYIITHGEEVISDEALRQFSELLQQRKTGKPIAYLIHEKEFFGRTFYVDERVLIPRPETEEMVEDALHFLKKHPEIKTVIDLGTGSGCIGITVALELSDREVVGLDISKKALEVAKINSKQLGCKNITFLESDLLSTLDPKTYTLATKTCILANLPYIGTEKNRFISKETHLYEPHLATYGGPDGLELYRRTWQQIRDFRLPVAALFMEIGFSQKEAMEKEAAEALPGYQLEIKNDLAGFPRTAIIVQ